MTEARIMGGTLAAFFALTVWVGVRGVPGIERGLQSAVADTLALHGIPARSVAVRGRTVTVIGGPEAPGDRLALSVAVNSVPGVQRVVSRLGDVGGGSPDDPLRVADASDAVGEGPRATPAVPGPEEGLQAAGDDPGGEAAEPEPAESGAAGGGGAQEPPAPATASAPVRSCGDRLTLLADGRTLPFPTGESTIADVDRAVLGEIASALVRCGEWTLTVVGYAGRDEHSDAWALADRRAYAVARILMDRGVDESRVATVTGSSALDSAGEPRVELVVSGGM